MTFLEKAMEISNEKNEGFSKGHIIDEFCPSDYSLEAIRECEGVASYEECEKCWNREMPDTEQNVVNVGELMDRTYEQGLNDAWELVRKIFRTDCADLQKVFGHSDEGVVIMTFDVQEALAKLKAYEEEQSKVEVGDVVFCSLVAEDDNDTEKKDNYGVVTGIYRDHYEILMKNGDTTGFKKETCKKKGKHLNIKSILEQIGE